MGRIKDVNKYPVKGSPSVLDTVVGNDSESNGKTVTFEIGSIMSIMMGVGQGNRILLGSVTWIPNTLNFQVSEVAYYLNNSFLHTDATVVTLDAGGTGNRIDLIAVNSLGEVVVIKGTEGVTAVKPTLPNSTEYLELTFVAVDAGGVVPAGSGYELIYDENVGEPQEYIATENTGSTRVITNFANVNSNSGSNTIRINSAIQGDKLLLTNSVPVTFNTTDYIQMYIYNSVAMGINSKIELSFYSGATKVSDSIEITDIIYHFDKSKISEYQVVQIPLSSFLITGLSFDSIELDFFEMPVSDVYIDSISRVSGLNLINTSDYVLSGGFVGTAQDLKDAIPVNTSELPEDPTNLYFTYARVLATVLTGLSVAVGGNIVSTDTVLGALGKLQNQVTANDSNAVHKTGVESIAGLKTFTNNTTSTAFIKSGGLVTEFLKADGSVDSNTYALNSAVVHLAGSETITGNKTIATQLNFSGNALGIVFNNDTTTLSGTAARISRLNNKVTIIGSGGAINTFGASFDTNNLLTTSRIYTFPDQSGTFALTNNPSSITATSFIKSGGLVTQFLKADGSVDSNTYQIALTNPVTGTGSAGFLPKFSGTSTVNNSRLYDSGVGFSFGGSTFFGGNEFIIPAFGSNTIFLGVTDGVQNPRATIRQFTTSGNQDVFFDSAFSSGNRKANWIFSSGSVTVPSLIISTPPTTSAVTYDILTRNIATGGVEKVASGSLSGTLEFNETDATVWNNGKSNAASNTSFGELALRSNTVTVNSFNSAFGNSALSANTTGTNNTGLGYLALSSNTAGTSNVAVGSFALSTAIGASNNVAVGNSALNKTTASSNVAIGNLSMFENTTGSSNVSVGVSSGRFIADGLTANVVSNTSIFLGANTKAFASNQTNQIVIGHDATGAGDNTVTLGNASIAKTVLRGVIQQTTYTVATLPAGTTGMFAVVTDATAPTYLGTLTGGGAVVCPVFYNGTAWVSH